jgi:hypothetical protein
MTTSSVRALLAAARSCVAEAGRASRRGEFRYAAELRASARTALAEVRAITPRAAVPVDPETAKKQATAKAYAAVLLKGLH